MQWSRLLLAVGFGALLVACEPGTFCPQCQPSERCKRCPAPKPEPTKIDWTGLAEELKKVEFGGDVTINVEAAEFILKPGEDAWKVRIANWNELADELRKIENANAAQAKHYALVYQLHAMLAEREPPATYNYWIWGPPPVAGTAPHPPLQLCPSTLPVFLFFPREAEFSSWRSGDYDCPTKSGGSNPICPNARLYDGYVDRFVRSLENCTDEVTTLRVHGFASSSGLGAIAEDDMQHLKEVFSSRFSKPPGQCDGWVPDLDADQCVTSLPNEQSQMFNLLVANSRARNVKEMLSKAAGDRVDVEVHVWCSYCDMVKARKVNDMVGGKYDRLEGMWNRRAEIRLVQ